MGDTALLYFLQNLSIELNKYELNFLEAFTSSHLTKTLSAVFSF
jgi:hypothetical protein